jgi:hypothetical protein
MLLQNISADRVISNTEVHQNTVFIKQRDIILTNDNTVFIKQRDIILTNDVWTVIINLDFSSYEQAISKLRDDLMYIQKFKTPLAPVHELNHIGYVLRKLEEEINDFREISPSPDKRCAVLSAVGSMLKWVFGTATLVGVEELHRTVDKMHKN